MFIFDGMESFLHTMRVYLFGRGLLTLGILAASFIGSAWASPIIPALVIAVGGAALSAVLRLTAQGRYQDKMVDLYRDDIAHDLGIAPQSVTREHLKVAAQDNDVIAQALTRQRRISIISFATSALAGAVTLGLLYFALPPGATAVAENPIAHAITEFFKTHFTSAANFLQYLSVGIISGTSSLILHDGLEAAIGIGSGVSKAAAHDLILQIDREMKQGRSISPEQVYSVLVAGDPNLEAAILRQFGETYRQMKPEDQRKVLATIGVSNEMQQLATGITQGTVHPGHLAYMIGEAGRDRRVAAAAQGIPAPVLQPVATPAPAPAPAPSNFVERLNLAPTEATGHVARLANERAMVREPALS